MVILQSAFSSIKEPPKSEWLRNAYDAIQNNLEKMPKEGWSSFQKFFCDNFLTSVSITKTQIYATKKQNNLVLIKKVVFENDTRKRIKIGCDLDNLIF
ncbi:hypothetical protein NUSPORA_02659 [Nucleospora cyclopteri]